MAYEQRPGNGTLFKNDKKTEEKHPNLKGDGLDLDGRPIWISGWTKTAKNGDKFISLSFKLKESGKAKANAYQPDPADDGSGIPF